MAKVVSIRARTAERKRGEILKAGLKVFAEKGFQGATMDDIALELEATKGLLYYHFKTKEEILKAILENNPLTQGVEQMFALLEKMRLREALETALAGVVSLMESNRELIRFIHVQSLLSSAEAEVVYTEMNERLYRGASRLIEHFKRAGEVRPEVDAHDLARLLGDLLNAYVISRQMLGPERQNADYLMHVIEILLHGIATPKAFASNRLH